MHTQYIHLGVYYLFKCDGMILQTPYTKEIFIEIKVSVFYSWVIRLSLRSVYLLIIRF